MKVKNISSKLFFLLLCFGVSFTYPFTSNIYGDSCPSCVMLMSPSSPITLTKDQALKQSSITLNTISCTSLVSIEGDFPPGLSLLVPVPTQPLPSLKYDITGTPTVAGSYDFTFLTTGKCPNNLSLQEQFLCQIQCFDDCPDEDSNCLFECIENCVCYFCNISLPVMIYVIDKDVEDETNPHSPEITASYQRAAIGATTDKMRAKCSNSINHDNIVKWKSPKNGPKPVAYAIYANKELTKYITTITNEDQFRFKFKQRNHSSRRINRFYIVSISKSGTISRPAVARIKNKNH